MAGEFFLEFLCEPGMCMKLVLMFTVSAFFLLWPGMSEFSTLFAESRTGKITRRLYQTILVPLRGDGRVILEEMALDDNGIDDGVLRLQRWLPTTEDRSVQCNIEQQPQARDYADRLAPAAPPSGMSSRASSTTASSGFSRSSTQPVVGETLQSASSLVTSASLNTDAEICHMEDAEVLELLDRGELAQHSLEKRLGDSRRAVDLRRKHFTSKLGTRFEGIPTDGFDYDSVIGSCCEVVVGYVPLPLGVVGPLTVDGEKLQVPMATTEGTLIASTNRGSKAILMSGGAETFVLDDGITRAPCVQLPSVKRAATVKLWLDDPKNQQKLANAFNQTTRYGHMKSVKTVIAGKLLYIRVKCFSGDAMGMNMVSKGTDKILELLVDEFADLEVVSLSGNFCTDKKPAAVNWIEGRGKSVCAEAVIKGDVVKKVLKTSVAKVVEINTKKNLIGSAMAGSIGGYNAHAANIVAAIFLATGQDPAQVVESANCMTLMESCNGGADLHISVTMPSVEVGTIGGGTILGPQGACLEMLGIKGSGDVPGENSQKLARIIAATVLCGELSLLSALSVGHLVTAHMKYNRSVSNLTHVNSQGSSLRGK
mmetsp:Transcript_2185/g.6500  ORF Transcript_2185/g.6500 Transcript_2185/m.6500 type:complete len:596 (+) Transcript_2185:135-1922(+)|eukprot:CAMPEP_0198731868 /NCGR_PEP_ID=MMETSP1475-20131203/32555_1 /TAXON_ID= ORGANISM="Unidentified sp., Strain CCMP1999" /NCGR_SAMPLE_ID=MMETSP1475 /ASSEMBLY_ACC=CAM_ASM_001111 /LENGTH=595 /DNA_ID=CAMNT_0044494883 /DNA_START=42 /DNA_END=1829 /DNA_ORIENTATION=-